MFKTTAIAFALAGGAAFAAPQAYTFDTSHSQVVFTYEHLGFSTTTGMFSGIQGTIEFDADAPAKSSVNVSFPVTSLTTGDDARTEHLLSPDFFGAKEAPEVTFKSTSIEVTGDKTTLITDDLTINGVTKSVVLDTVMNQQGQHPMMDKPWMGFTATTKLLRSDFDMGAFAPAVSDEIEVKLSVEAQQAAE